MYSSDFSKWKGKCQINSLLQLTILTLVMTGCFVGSTKKGIMTMPLQSELKRRINLQVQHVVLRILS